MPLDETLPLSTDPDPQRNFVNLSPRGRLTYEELMRLDPQLAGLFMFGHELLTRLNEPGAVFLLAHVGREISLGLTRALAGVELQLSKENTGEVKNTERNREKIGGMLQLDGGHDLVKAWFDLHNKLVGAAHYRITSPSVEKVRTAFTQLCDLFYGRVAPYFDTHAELDRFWAIESPTANDLENVRSLLVRPQIRRQFFARLQHSGWLTVLDGASYFNSPPERKVWPDGAWRMCAWPEGEYLVRVAPRQPERVVQILLQIPKEIQNPAVWAVVVDAAKAMPSIHSTKLVPLLKHALENALLVLFPHEAIGLVKVLAEQRESSAFELAESLLDLSSDTKRETVQQGAPKYRRSSRMYETEWMLVRLELYDLKKFCAEALPALETFDPSRTIEFLAEQLNRSIKLGEPDHESETRYPHSHGFWCRYLDHDREEDVRVVFAVAVTSIAKRVAKQNAASAKAAFDHLQKYSHGLFIRIRYIVLEAAGVSLKQELDRVMASGELLDPPFGSREANALLRTQFRNASPTAKRLLCYAIERGPSVEKLKAELLPNDSDAELSDDVEHPFSEEKFKEAIERRQRQLLRRFHDQIPPELQPLAERLGVQPQVPSPEERALDEDGYWVGSGFTYGGDESPKTSRELGSMSTEDALEFLATWQTSEVSFDGPSTRGLEGTLAGLANENIELAINLLDRRESLPIGYLKAILDGISNVAEKGSIPWDNVLPLIATFVEVKEVLGLVVEREEVDPSHRKKRSEDEWIQALRAIARLIREGCAKNLIPYSLSEYVWRCVEALIHSPFIWAGGWTSPQKNQFENALMSALNSLAGDSVHMLVDVALWEHRNYVGNHNSVDNSQVIPDLEERLTPLLDRIISHQGITALGAQSMLGHFIPQVGFLAPHWMAKNENQLFGDGVEHAGQNPVWGTYVTRARIYDSTFRSLRRWYLRAAEAASQTETGEDQSSQSSDFSLTRGLATHIIVGVIRGLCQVGDEDLLVEKTFSNVPVKDRSHAYWEIFRGWSDSPQPIPLEYAERIVTFWDWRLAAIESTSETSEREDEADGLTWFLKTPYVPAADAIRLGLRTLKLNTGKQKTRATTWERLGELAQVDTTRTYGLVELLIEQELAADYAFLPYEDVAPLLKAALCCDDSDTQAQAKRLVHKLGERGFLAFGRLLSPDQN